MTGQELKKLRERFGLSRHKAARQLEVSERSLARWESGEKRIPDGVVKLLRLLNRAE